VEVENLAKLFNISSDSEDYDIEENYKKLDSLLSTVNEKAELLEKYKLVSTKEKRYLYFLTSLQGFSDISELDSEIISRPNYIGPRQWLELLD